MSCTGFSRRGFLSLVGGASAWLVFRNAAGAEAIGRRNPNIIVILSDDHGYADVGVQGCTDIPTPNLDSLAREGMRLSNGYVSCPVCSPTRAGVMTGRYQQRFAHETNAQAPEGGLPLAEIALPAILKQAGYATGMVGKWHLGAKPEYHPLRRGFDEFYGFLGGAHPYVDLSAKAAAPIMRGTEPVDEKEYLTDAFGREALAFIEKNRARPFFLYLTFNAVHAPLQAPEKYLSRFPQIEDRTRKTYAAMLSAMDDAIGALLKKLRELGLEEQTLITFSSDNGGPAGNGSRNAPLRGTKGQVWEGGIRVPFFVRWKGKIPAGKVYSHPVIALDVVPTAIAAAGGTLPGDRKYDGVNLLPYLTGEKTGAPHQVLFWRFGANQKAVRSGPWKLVELGKDGTHFFNLDSDVGEERDLAEKSPDKVKELRELLAAWEKELPAPPPQGVRKQQAKKQQPKQARKQQPKKQREKAAKKPA